MYQQQTLVQLIQSTRSIQGDKNAYLQKQLQEIKKELNDSDQQTLLQALQKLYFLYFEGFDLQFVDFLLINAMAMDNYSLKRLSYSLSSLMIKPQSSSLMMSTNIFKKEIIKPQFLEASSALTCLTNIITPEMGQILIKEAMQLHNHTQDVIRKKASALISKIFSLQPDLIPSYLDKILSRISNEETNPAVLATNLSIINVVLNKSPSMYPVFIKPLFELLKKQKTNWFLIKLIKIFHKLIKHEPRLVPKLAPELDILLEKTKSKSLEHELINLILTYFKDHKNLYDQAQDRLKSFLTSKDKNLRQVGLINLKLILKNDKKVLFDYKTDLLEIFKENDKISKFSIMELFKEFLTKGDLEDICQFFLNNASNNVLEDVISFVIEVIQKDNFENVEDFEWIFVWVLPQLAKKTKTLTNARQIQKLIFNLISMVEDLKELVNETAIQILTDLLEKQDLDLNLDNHPIQIVQINKDNKELTVKEVLFQTMVFLVGEYSKLFQQSDQYINVLEFLSNELVYNQFQNAHSQINITIFKIMVNFCKCFDQGDMDQIREGFKLYFKIISLLNSYDKQDQDIYNSLIFRKLSLERYEINQENLSQIAQDIQESQINQISSLQTMYIQEFEPIHPDSQKMIKAPENLDINEEFDIDEKEIQLIQSLMQKMDQYKSEKPKDIQRSEQEEGQQSSNKIYTDNENNSNQSQSQQQQQEILEQQEQKQLEQKNDQNSEQETQDQIQRPQQKAKKQYKLKQQAELPQ